MLKKKMWMVGGLLLVLMAGSPVLLAGAWAANASDLIEMPDRNNFRPFRPTLDQIVPLLPNLCVTSLPSPVVTLSGTENYSVNGNNFVRYLLTVENRNAYPGNLFAPAPNLPPCGLNTSAARTWVIILDPDDNFVYGFCALASAEDLDGLWFAVPAGQDPPPGVQVILWDRLCQEDWLQGYKSDLVPIVPEMFAPPPTADLQIQSGWSGISPVVDGIVSPGEWLDAGSLPLYDSKGLQRGTLYVKNDTSAMYVLLDMTGDNQPGATADDDFSGIAFDIELDGFKAPYVDLKYATPAGTETLGIQWAVSESGWTGVNPTSLSFYQEGFGAGVLTADPHRVYEYQLDYSEIGIDWEDVLANPEQLFQARINVKVVSKQPNFSVYYPSSQYGAWQNPMIRVALDIGTLALDPTAPIISGIGLIPRTFIDQTNGLATTGPGHQLDVIDAPFGKHLRVIGNLDKLRALGVQHYAIAYCNMALNACDDLYSGSFNFAHWKFVGDSRTNYYWDGSTGKYVLDSVGPATIFDNGSLVIKAYPMPSAALSWYFPNLLFDWRTTGATPVGSGLYKVHLFGFTGPSIANIIPTLDGESALVVRIDNTYPVMLVNSIRHKGDEIEACGIVELDNVKDTLEVNVSAYDPDGFLRDFNLHALYGNNQSFSCEAQDYASYLGGGGSRPNWAGALPSATFVCQGDAGTHWATSCGYTFRVNGWDRAINGYGPIHYNAGHKTITVLLPGFTF